MEMHFPRTQNVHNIKGKWVMSVSTETVEHNGNKVP